MRDWSQLPVEVLSSIFDLLSFKDQCRVQAVCLTWNLAGQICSKIKKDSLRDEAPWLMLPLTTKPKYRIDPDDTSCTIFNLKEKKMYKLNCLMEELGDSYCVGSSHGWLVLLDQNAHVFLFNPFTNSRIQLPSVDFLGDRCDFVRKPNGYEFAHTPSTYENTMSASWVRKIIFCKAILCIDDDTDEFYAVAVIHSEHRVAYCRKGDDRWIDLNSNGDFNAYFFDIVYKHNQLYIVSSKDLVEMWDIHGSVPIRTAQMDELFEAEDEVWDPENSVTNYYAVKSDNDLLSIERYEDTIETDNGIPLHLKTTKFIVYKLDFDTRLWSRVRSLGDHALFVGRNHSMSLVASEAKGFKRNSIYFTDDCWRLDKQRPPSYHEGDDVGVFDMENGSIQQIYQSQFSRKLPQHFWIVTNLSNL